MVDDLYKKRKYRELKVEAQDQEAWKLLGRVPLFYIKLCIEEV